MERLRSLFWSSLTAIAMMGLLTGLATSGAMGGPTVKITEPTHGQVVTGEIIVKVAYRSGSDQPVTRLEILVDGKPAREWPLATPRMQGEQSFTWDFSFAASTAHTIGARATDAAGEAGSAEITVTVQSAATQPGGDQVPPIINIWYPAQGAHVSGEVEVRAEARDNAAVKWVFFYIDGEIHKAIGHAPPFEYLWDTRRAADGPHVIQAKAMDEAENAATSAEVTVFVENRAMTAPRTDLTPPPTGAGTGTASVTPAPQLVTPPEVAPQLPVTRTDFGQGTAGAPSAARQVQRAQGSVWLSRVGYVPAIDESAELARTSRPRTMLAALPRTDQPPGTPSVSLPEPGVLTAHTAELSGDFEHTTLAALGDQQRLTTPRRLPDASAVTPTFAQPERGLAGPLEPQIAALEVAPRITMPRPRMIDSTATAVAARPEAGWVRVDPVLQIAPEGETSLLPRTTSPERALTGSDAAALAPPVLSEAATAGAETVVIQRPDDGELGAMIARLDQRTTRPGTLVDPNAPAQLSATQSDVQGVRVAMLPEEATHAAIPADGRLTAPSGAKVAPVATMPFEDVAILFDNQALELRAQPEMKQGISIAPLREIFEHTDGVLYWFPIEKRVRAINKQTDIRLQIGDPAVYVNADTKVLEVAPYIKCGRTMVPLQFVADTLDVTITFNPESGQICIISNKF